MFLFLQFSKQERSGTAFHFKQTLKRQQQRKHSPSQKLNILVCIKTNKACITSTQLSPTTTTTTTTTKHPPPRVPLMQGSLRAYLSAGSVKSCFVLLTTPSLTNTRLCSDSKKERTDMVLLLSTLEMVSEFSDTLWGGRGSGCGQVGSKKIFLSYLFFFLRVPPSPLTLPAVVGRVGL